MHYMGVILSQWTDKEVMKIDSKELFRLANNLEDLAIRLERSGHAETAKHYRASYIRIGEMAVKMQHEERSRVQLG